MLTSTAGMSLVIILVRELIDRGILDRAVDALRQLLGGLFAPSDAASLLYLVIGSLAGAATYIALNLLLGGRELPTLVRIIRPQPV